MFSYRMFAKSRFTQRSNHFKGGNFSADGEFVLGDRGRRAKYDGNGTVPIPSYLPTTYTVTGSRSVDSGRVNSDGVKIYVLEDFELERPLTNNHPDYNHEQALFITSIRASAEGASDGWLWEVVT